MKKLILFFVMFIFCSHSFAQININILNEKQVLIDEEADVKLYSMGQNGFVLVKSFESEKSAQDKTWRFIHYKPDLTQKWTTDITLEKSCILSAVNIDGENVNLVYQVKSNASIRTLDQTIATIDADGEFKTKDFVLTKVTAIKGYVFADGLCYFAAESVASDLISGDVSSTIYAIDFKELNIIQKKFVIPATAEVKNQFTDGKIAYFHLNYSQKNMQADTIIGIENGELVHKIPVILPKETEFEKIDLIRTDSTHSFLVGQTKKWVDGSRNYTENFDYSFFISKIEKGLISPLQLVEKKYADAFKSKRDVQILHDWFGNLNHKSTVCKYFVSSSFRSNNKNYVVFDKYITGERSQKQSREQDVFFYTNSIILGFNDEGEMEWGNDLEYDIVTPYMSSVTSAIPNANGNIILFGEFEKEFSTVTFSSTDGSITDGLDKFKIADEIDMDEYLVKNNITHLYGDKYVVWGNENETYEQNKLRVKNKDYNLKFNLKIVELK